MQINSSILAAHDILSLYGSSVSELGITEMADKLGSNRSTVTRIVSTLLSLGYLRKNEGKQPKYSLGSKVMDLARAYLANLDLRELSLPYLRELQEKTNELVTLSVLEECHGLYIALVESQKRIRMIVEEKDICFQLHAGAPGKLLLAYLPEERVQEILDEEGMCPYTDRTITKRDELFRVLRTIRENNVSVSMGEHIEYGCTVSVPVRDYSENVVAALSIAWVAVGDTSENERKYTPMLLDAAGRLSRELGYSPRADNARLKFDRKA